MIELKIRNSLDERKLSKNEKKELSKSLTEIKRAGRRTINNCCLCGKEFTSYCNSHSIPRFDLRQISKNGKIIIGHNFSKNPITEKYGISNALTFKCICENCDHTFFKEYEDPKIFERTLSNIAINEIATKINLKHYYKRFEEENIFLYLKDEIHKRNITDFETINFIDNKILTTQLDLKEARNKITKLARHKEDTHFYVIDDFNLNYPTKLAYQGFIALTKGFTKIINDTYNYDPTYKIEVLYLCIFPYKTGTKIVLFCDDGSKRLKDFYRTYKELDLDSKLYLLNYMLLLYDEEWCVSGDFDTSVINKETLELINQTTDILLESDSPLKSDIDYKHLREKLFETAFELKTDGNVYNFLKNQ